MDPSFCGKEVKFSIKESKPGIATGLRSINSFIGYAFALLLLLSGRYIDWILTLFPLWILLISIYILIDNLRPPSQAGATSP